jgi:hypothetical protein
MHLFTTYFKSTNQERQKELDFCIKKNCLNDIISRITIFLDSNTTEDDLYNLGLDLTKIDFVKINRLPTYKDWLINGINSNEEFLIFSNADIYFNETLEEIKKYPLNEKAVMCISRYEETINGIEKTKFSFFSQDVWIIKRKNIPSITFIDNLNISTGVVRCDNKFAYFFASNGWDLYNPVEHIKVIHRHESNIRTYDYYSKENTGSVAFVEESHNYMPSEVMVRNANVNNLNSNYSSGENIPFNIKTYIHRAIINRYIIANDYESLIKYTQEENSPKLLSMVMEHLDKHNDLNFVEICKNALQKNNTDIKNNFFKPILSHYKKQHLSGWGIINCELENFSTTTDAINLVSFLSQSYTLYNNRIEFKQTLSKPWIGIEHLTNYIPEYYNFENNSHKLFQNIKDIGVLDTCKGILFTSETQLKNQINNLFLNNIKKDFIYHPIIRCNSSIDFNFNLFLNNKNKQLINLGWYNRNFTVFEKLQVQDYKKIFVFGGKDSNYRYNIFQKDLQYHNIDKVTTEIAPHLKDNELNELLSNNIVFINLYDAAANNAILDCIERSTPIVVNRLPACEEYLGKEYPLFYDTIDQVQDLLSFEKIYLAHSYLKNIDKTKFTMESFITKINQFVESL